jgi:hypothetical protein
MPSHGCAFSICTYTPAHMHRTGSVQKAIHVEHGVPEEAVQREVPPLGEPKVMEPGGDLLKCRDHRLSTFERQAPEHYKSPYFIKAR